MQDSNSENTAKGGRKRTGSLQFRSGSWYAVTTSRNAEGKPVRKWTNLHTGHKSTAKRLMARLLDAPAEQLPAVLERPETYEELADRVAKRRRESGVEDTRSEELRERIDILPTLGVMAIRDITPDDVESIYDSAKERGKSLSHLRSLRQVMRSRFTVALRESLITVMPTDTAEMPRVKVDNRERAVLTDSELQKYLSWQHPDPNYQLGVLERQTMSVLARMFGGLRTGDLHAIRWDQLDAPNFTVGTAPRQKTAKPQRITIPEALRPILSQWWHETAKPAEDTHKPVSVLVFPALRGDGAGKEAKQGVSHAEGLRRDLGRVLGLETWNPAKRRFEPTKDPLDPTKAREMTERERELLVETEVTRPVDFHSWRRAFVQGLADANVTAQQAQKLAGHADLGAHERYLRSSRHVLTIPSAALPSLKVDGLATIPCEILSQLRDLNSRPAVYETAALPLS
jgi:integrase